MLVIAVAVGVARPEPLGEVGPPAGELQAAGLDAARPDLLTTVRRLRSVSGVPMDFIEAGESKSPYRFEVVLGRAVLYPDEEVWHRLVVMPTEHGYWREEAAFALSRAMTSQVPELAFGLAVFKGRDSTRDPPPPKDAVVFRSQGTLLERVVELAGRSATTSVTLRAEGLVAGRQHYRVVFDRFLY